MRRARVLSGPVAWTAAGILLLVLGGSPLAMLVAAQQWLLAALWMVIVGAFLIALHRERFALAVLALPPAVLVLLLAMD
ncbi:MAG: hypothetical protein SF002_05710 [Alphaproteobacteria bacterium]|nr:hypothetical protein [Alphaproteobacteria bacterium]